VEDLEQKLRRVAGHRAVAEAKAGRERDLAESRDRLERIVQKKMKTAFVGALARVERAFGALWGHGKSDLRLTPEERAWRAVWDECRTEILNNGNHQARALEAEFPQYEINWTGYRVVLTPLPAPAEEDGTDEQADV
jgi:hypothetical protein